jgi:hypothetical protein
MGLFFAWLHGQMPSEIGNYRTQSLILPDAVLAPE